MKFQRVAASASPHSEPHSYGIYLPLFLGFVKIKWVLTQLCIEKDLNPAIGGVSDRVKLSRLRRQIRTLSIRLPSFLYLRYSSEDGGPWMPGGAQFKGPAADIVLKGRFPLFFYGLFLVQKH